jgi:NAD(P)-dependent dehydrogenase (short-subunit alcohol dehydrogenase family)
MSVVLADFEADALEATERDFRLREFDVLAVLADVSRRESMQELHQRTLERYGDVHILVNNAGVADTQRLPIWDEPPTDFEWVLGINLWGVIHGIQTFVPSMLKHGQPGHVVNTASVAGLIPGRGIYGLSKHAVVALTEGLYQDLADAGSNLHASVLCPPFVNTRIFDSARNRPGVTTFESLSTPDILQRAMEPSAIADAVFEGIRDEQLFIIPHSEFDAVISDRAERIVARQNPRHLATTERG